MDFAAIPLPVGTAFTNSLVRMESKRKNSMSDLLRNAPHRHHPHAETTQIRAFSALTTDRLNELTTVSPTIAEIAHIIS